LCCTANKKGLLQFDGDLSDVDPEIASIIHSEKQRQASYVAAGGLGFSMFAVPVDRALKASNRLPQSGGCMQHKEQH
jgi:hypothetical protein